MKRSELNIEMAKKIEELVKYSDENSKLMTPLEFTEAIIVFFEEIGILNPTHFIKEEDDTLRQITGFAPEDE